MRGGSAAGRAAKDALVKTIEHPWYRQVNAQQWRAFLATFFGWLLDGFDFTIMSGRSHP